jgi:hypothetical protein
MCFKADIIFVLGIQRNTNLSASYELNPRNPRKPAALIYTWLFDFQIPLFLKPAQLSNYRLFPFDHYDRDQNG